MTPWFRMTSARDEDYCLCDIIVTPARNRDTHDRRRVLCAL
jgi:hypothetical protein